MGVRKTTTVQLGVEQRATLRRVADEMAKTSRVAGLDAIQSSPTATQLLNGAVELLAGVWDGYITPTRSGDIHQAFLETGLAKDEEQAEEFAARLIEWINDRAVR